MTKRLISQGEYDNHDCHASIDDGCGACILWQEQEGERMLQRTQQFEYLRKGAWAAVEVGYYSIEEYFDFCRKNGILIF